MGVGFQEHLLVPRLRRRRLEEGSTGTNLRNERERGERPDRSHAHQGERGDRPKRSFDRRSGTGRGKEVSKSGGGGHNWGNEADKSEQAAEAEIQEGVVADEAVEEVAEVVVEEEEKTLTLDEYLAQKKQARSSTELFGEVEIRAVTNEFSDAALLTKDGKTPDFIESSYEKVFTKKTSGRKKTLLTDVGFSVAPVSAPARNVRVAVAAVVAVAPPRGWPWRRP
ncbi:hypothetical protein SPRG_22274 [Saprolegnia parasitica CBS 223.65]|uniref:Hyaluronan/mRNA-binding protein domain-containing protein n=1 Tax=Saprolegnia parasitica (strain CBS 223.65) TaxID=695850 RepID=A0A067C3V2_SAPPC|nr:hypothetical protein SPRG_22274 [Saprolegnia parasitica CBS 223.65]KDO21201.1 hypothetical protein SPRG_22274 [Saprolegnia parasitica CBS 223.65]|eukprot:XP_012208120.1 hypothetical protein SPRG_22274 [Saprolegnia parasitica CBS 223.65]